MEHKSFSLADQVFEQLETDILLGVYKRGELLTEQKLCDVLGVSRTPVREAIRRLEQEHVIEESGKGIVVLGIIREDLSDIMDVRIRVEGLAAARCAELITDEQIAELRETLELQEFYLTKQDSDRIKAMDSRFHALIYRYSGSTVFYDTLTPLHKKVQRYRKAAVENSSRAAKSVEEHRLIFDAIAARDADLAAERIVQHAKNAKAHILKG